MPRTTALIMVLAWVFFGQVAMAALTPAEHPLFAEDAVHEIHLTFAQVDWYDQLTDNFENYDDPPYLEASFDWDSTHLTSIGVRFKGNSSYWGYYGLKKSFKLDIDEFVPGQEIDGLDKLNLNNCFLDPSYVREKAAYELCDALGMATGRTNYAAVYINGEYWGLYLLVEQQDQEFIESRWGSGEDGNQWKGEPHGSMEYLGAAESSYYDDYELKTNETENDWSDLVDFIDQLNNTSLAALPDSMHNRLDVNSAMAMLAVDNYTVNLDSYVGRCANYYFYHRELDDRFVFTKWDQNESYGVFNQYNLSTTQMQQLSPYWVNPQFGEDRPLAERLWQVPEYEEVYLGHMKKLMAGAAAPATLIARMEELRDLIRPYVYDDPNSMFTSSQFESCMTSTVYATSGPGPGRPIPPLQTFLTARHTYLSNLIGTWTPIEGLVINEVMAKNSSTLADEAGEFEDWIEIANTGSSSIALGGLGLTDHFEGSPDFVFPDVTLAPGEYVIVWADEDTDQGDLHAPFKLDADGEDVYLTDGGVIIDQVTFPALAADASWGRWADGTGEWTLLSVATPGLENRNPTEPETVILFINEFVALNDAGIQDEADQFEDWLEIYNPGPEDVEMGGLFLTDDLTLPTQWSFPDTVLAAGDFLLVWCDNDPEDGPLHATFKLSGGGEDIGLFGRLAAGNELIDSYTFGEQASNISEGRATDGGDIWAFFTEPTPGSSNSGTSDVPGALVNQLRLLPSYPNPFNPQTKLCFEIPQGGRVRLDIYDVRGRLVTRLKDESLAAGYHEVNWNGCDGGGLSVSSGVYFSRLSYGGEILTGRMTLVR
nr:CotH kinase family protein [Candidatus Krumholzibacteria bacterium]